MQDELFYINPLCKSPGPPLKQRGQKWQSFAPPAAIQYHRLSGLVCHRPLQLYPLFLKHGKPHYIRSDNGSEFIAHDLQDWLKKVGIKPIQIYPGSPWENGYNERFNGTLRKEVLNAEWFSTIRQAQVVINTWLKQYNHIRPHQSLNMRPPVPETLQQSGT